MEEAQTALATAEARELWRKLVTLTEVGRIFNTGREWLARLHETLELLGQRHGAVRGFVALRGEDETQLTIAASYCLNAAAKRTVYRLGEGPVGQVAESGKIFIASAPQDTPAMPQTEAETRFIGVPLIHEGRTWGVLGVDFFDQEGRSYERVAQFLLIVAAFMAQALRVANIVETERRRLADENDHLKQELRERYDFSHIVGNSSAIKQVYEQVAQVARSTATVLLLGESGTGKELIAHAIHYNSLRADGPFIKVNCAALPETLLEAELFGHEKGAFTGAAARKKGRFELADNGTLFLDEIGDLSAATQIKLLRVLQEREFERVGGTETLKINVRLIAATNRNLEKAIAEGTFREDLYYRLNVFTIFLPPLRARKSDILLLAEHFLEKYEREHGKRIRRISTPAIDMLTSYHWPGNVRELENVIERAVLVCDENVIHGHHLPPTLQTAEGSGTVTHVSLAAAVEAYERDLIQDALKTSQGNKAQAAQLLQTTERILSYKIKNYHIDWQRFKS